MQRVTAAAMLGGCLVLGGCAGKRAISGQIMDRNGAPMDRVIVSVAPGNVELVTDSEGRFTLSYLRSEGGDRVKLDARQTYRVEAFRAGYHVEGVEVYYKRGALELEPILLTEDTIRVDASEADLDPARFPDRTHAAGTNYEGE